MNTFTSLAYVAAGAWIWREDRARGTALMAVGVGSAAYHARGGTAARCLTSDDCPREAEAVVCDSNADPDKDCVRCASGACERVVVERCP